MEALQDIGMLLLIPIAIWAFLPKALRITIVEFLHGTIPALLSLAALIRQGLARLEPIAFRLIVGKSREEIRAQRVDTLPAPQLDRTREVPAKPRTDGRTDGVPVPSKVEALLQLDRSKLGVVKALVLAGWSVEDIRGVIKGANGDLGALVDQARSELDRPGPSRPELVGERHDRIRREESTTPAA